MTYWQYLIKVGRRRRRRKKEERRKKIEKYFKSSCLRELKIQLKKSDPKEQGGGKCPASC